MKLTQEKKNIKIAWAHGWKIGDDGYWVDPDGGTYSNGHYFVPPFPPNYFLDLNATHGARRAVITTHTLRVDYMNNLRKIVGVRCEKNKSGSPLVSDYDCTDATASEHSEAFGMTIGLWKRGE